MISLIMQQPLISFLLSHFSYVFQKCYKISGSFSTSTYLYTDNPQSPISGYFISTSIMKKVSFDEAKECQSPMSGAFHLYNTSSESQEYQDFREAFSPAIV